jgi:hypothetical protein
MNWKMWVTVSGTWNEIMHDRLSEEAISEQVTAHNYFYHWLENATSLHKSPVNNKSFFFHNSELI